MRIVAVLHDVRSIHNTGSIFRTADGAGLEKIYCCGITPTPLDRFKKIRPDFHKVSLGAEDSIPWEYGIDVLVVIGALKKDGWKIFAVEQSEGSVPYCAALAHGATAQDKIAIVMGHEVEGLPPGIIALADKVLEIPMFENKESLNVGVAFGIVAFRLRCNGDTIKKWDEKRK